jgi:hypothetical protein
MSRTSKLDRYLHRGHILVEGWMLAWRGKTDRRNFACTEEARGERGTLLRLVYITANSLSCFAFLATMGSALSRWICLVIKIEISMNLVEGSGNILIKSGSPC